MVETLRDLGYHVIAAADATGALGFLDHPAIRIDVMLTNVVMRGMNGRELAEQARKLRPGFKIRFMTGYSAMPSCIRVASTRTSTCFRSRSPRRSFPLASVKLSTAAESKRLRVQLCQSAPD
jgi:CheY-like chemotaxis protein